MRICHSRKKWPANMLYVIYSKTVVVRWSRDAKVVMIAARMRLLLQSSKPHVPWSMQLKYYVRCTPARFWAHMRVGLGLGSLKGSGDDRRQTKMQQKKSAMFVVKHKETDKERANTLGTPSHIQSSKSNWHCRKRGNNFKIEMSKGCHFQDVRVLSNVKDKFWATFCLNWEVIEKCLSVRYVSWNFKTFPFSALSLKGPGPGCLVNCHARIGALWAHFTHFALKIYEISKKQRGQSLAGPNHKLSPV